MDFQKEYQDMFSKVTASRETHRRIEHMAMGKYQRKRNGSGIIGKVLVAAVIVSLLAVTASAATNGWFTKYFSGRGERPLSEGQVKYIEENEQTIGDSQNAGGWTVELSSAISDSMKGYVTLRFTAPADVDLEGITDGSEYVGPRNEFLPKDEDTALSSDAYPDLPGVIANIGSKWVADGDGLKNTATWVLDISPDVEWAKGDPMASDTKWHIHLVDFVKGFPEQETLAEGTWDFDFTFNKDDSEVSLLDSPRKTQALGLRGNGEDIMTDVTMVSATLRPFGLTIYYGDESDELDYSRDSVAFAEGKDGRYPWYAVMKDGQKVALINRGGNPIERYAYLEAETPLVLSEVDYVLLADGTKLPMPD